MSRNSIIANIQALIVIEEVDFIFKSVEKMKLSQINSYFPLLSIFQCYMRALFDYDPEDDTLLPCKEIGLPFQYGDILQVSIEFSFDSCIYSWFMKIHLLKKNLFSPPLQIINVKDPNWWQAKHIGQNEITGLIPSQELEERRKAFVPPEADFAHSISICGTKVSVTA